VNLPTVGGSSALTVEVYCGGLTAKVVASGGAKINGDFVSEAAELNLTTGQHLLLRSNGTNWLILAGEPKREQKYAQKAFTKGEAEAAGGIELSATRPVFINCFIGAFSEVGGVAIGVASPQSLIVLPGQKVKGTLAVELNLLVL
jgi:hypothetical protein